MANHNAVIQFDKIDKCCWRISYTEGHIGVWCERSGRVAAYGHVLATVFSQSEARRHIKNLLLEEKRREELEAKMNAEKLKALELKQRRALEGKEK